MKKVILWLLVIMVFASLSGFIVSLTNGNGGIAEVFGKSNQLDEEKKINLDGIKDTNLKTVNADIEVFPTDQSEMRIHLYGTVKGNRIENKLEVSLNDGVLGVEVKHKKPSFALFDFASNENIKLDIYLPRNYTGNLEGNTTSGSIKISDISVANLVVLTNSGDINLEGINAAKADITSIAGKVDLSGLMANTKVSTVSGGIKVNYSELVSDLSIGTTSGDTNITVPENSGFEMNFQTVSGSFSSELPLNPKDTGDTKNIKGSYGDGKIGISVSSESGSLKLIKK